MFSSYIYRRKIYYCLCRYSLAFFFNLFLIDIYTPSCYYILVPREQRKKIGVAATRRQEGRIIMEKYCVKCGRKFVATGREVICPECREAAAEESKKAAVMRAKRASWTGESVPVRISGRASTVIRKYGAANDLPFAQALDDLLKASDYFKGMQMAWEDITPYKSRRRDKNTTETTSTPQDAPQGKPQEVKQAAKTSTSKKTSSKPSKPSSTKKG